MFGSVTLTPLVLAACLFARSASAAPAMDLTAVLAKMDQTAAEFHTADAEFTWTTYNSVVNEVDSTQTGKIYFERSNNEVKMSATLSSPDAEQVVFSEGKIQVYKPQLGTVDVYPAGAHRDQFETFLVLGFLSSGEAVQNSFELKYQGPDQVDQIEAAKLDLTPKADDVKRHFPEIVLWINPENGISIQQKLIENGGDYRLAKYSNIHLGRKFPASVFKLKTHGHPTITNH
jgi:outer membrane lipoprotein-sorting protein